MRKQIYNFLVEHIRGISGDEARYGIAILQPDRGIKKCKIRKLTVEYLLSNAEIVIICPKSCGRCGRKMTVWMNSFSRLSKNIMISTKIERLHHNPTMEQEVECFAGKRRIHFSSNSPLLFNILWVFASYAVWLTRYDYSSYLTHARLCFQRVRFILKTSIIRDMKTTATIEPAMVLSIGLWAL